MRFFSTIKEELNSCSTNELLTISREGAIEAVSYGFPSNSYCLLQALPASTKEPLNSIRESVIKSKESIYFPIDLVVSTDEFSIRFIGNDLDRRSKMIRGNVVAREIPTSHHSDTGISKNQNSRSIQGCSAK